jgi:hypothetical protein
VEEATVQQGISSSHTTYKWLGSYKESGEATLENWKLAASAQPQAAGRVTGGLHGGLAPHAHRLAGYSSCPSPAIVISN